MTTIHEILDGPVAERTADDAAAGAPVTEAQARYVIRDLEAKSDKATRIRFAELALQHSPLSAEAQRLWSRYLRHLDDN